MRICLLYDRKHGGLPKVLLEVASLLSSNGDTVLVCGPVSHHRKWTEGAVESGVAVFEMSSHNVCCHTSATRRAVASFNPDVVVSAHRGCNVRTDQLCRKLKITHVITMHGNPISKVDMQYSRIWGLALRNYLWRRAISNSPLVICCSEWVASGLVTGFRYPEPQTRVIYNGIDLEDFSVSAPKRLPEPKGAASYSVLAVGRLSREKKPHMFVDLVAALRARGLKVDGIWLGDGPLREQVTRYSMQREVAGFVSFPGDTESPQVFYRNSSFFAHFRVDEAFGLVLAEAQAAGLPVVAFRAGAVPEVVKDGETGLLCDEDDVSRMVAHIKSLVDDPALYSRMSAAGMASAQERFSATRMGCEYRTAIHRLVQA